MKVIGYVRVSTEEQARDGVSLDAQRAKVEQFVALHSLDLVDVLTDAGASAKSLERPGLTRALGMLDAGVAGGIVIAKLDRLSRSVRDFAALTERYFDERAGKHLFSVGDSIDTRTPGGRLVLNVLMSVAQWEREIVVERTRDALRHKQARGERVGRIPFGSTLAEDGRTLVRDETIHAVLDLIPGWRDLGWTYKAIGQELVSRGLKPVGKSRWSPSSIHYFASHRHREAL